MWTDRIGFVASLGANKKNEKNQPSKKTCKGRGKIIKKKLVIKYKLLVLLVQTLY